MTLTTVAIGGTPIETLGLVLTDEDGLRSVPKRTYPTVAIAGRPGLRRVSSNYATDVRTVHLKLEVTPASFADRAAKLAAIVALFPGEVELTCIDAPSLVLTGVLEEIPVTTPFRVYATLPVYPDIALVCHDPLWYDASAVAQTITAGNNGTISVGTADTRRLTIGIDGPVTNPIILLKDQDGNELARMTITGQLYDAGTATATQPVSLSIDCDAHTIVGTRQNGTTFSALSWLGATESFFNLRLSEAVSGFALSCAAVDLAVSHYRAYWTPS